MKTTNCIRGLALAAIAILPTSLTVANEVPIRFAVETASQNLPVRPAVLATGSEEVAVTPVQWGYRGYRAYRPYYGGGVYRTYYGYGAYYGRPNYGGWGYARPYYSGYRPYAYGYRPYVTGYRGYGYGYYPRYSNYGPVWY